MMRAGGTDWRREAGDRRNERPDLTTRSLHLRAESLDEATRSVEAVLSTETRATVFDPESFRVIEEVLIAGGFEAADQIVLLANHNRWSLDDVLGSIRQMRVNGKKIIGRLYFAEGDDSADRAWNKVKQGHLTDVSLGYRPVEAVDIPPGTSQTVDGRRYTAGQRTLRITTKWRAREGSLVPIGADEAAKIRRQEMESTIMNKKLREYLQSVGLSTHANDEAALAFLQSLPAEQRAAAEALQTADDPTPPVQRAEPTPGARPAGAPASPEAGPGRSADAPGESRESRDSRDSLAPDQVRDEVRRAVVAERERVAAIRQLAGDDMPPALVERAIAESLTADQAGRLFLEEQRRTRAAPLTQRTPPEEQRSLEIDAIAAGLLQRNRLPIFDENASESVKRRQERVAEMSDRFRGLSLIDICRNALRLANVREPHGYSAIIQRAVSTGELVGIFSTSVHARLIESYIESGDTTQGWVRETDVNNFQTQDRSRLGKTAGLEKLARGDAAAHAKIGDVTESYKIARYAKQFEIDEQDILDDNLDALMRMPAEMGNAAARLRPDLVYAILLANASLGADSVALFHATHANLGTGGGSALAASSLEAGIIAMGQQTEDSINLNVSPSFLLVPQDLRFTAQVLLQSVERIIASASGGTLNPLRDLNIQLVVDNRLGAAGVTDPDSGTAYAGTATNWFLAGAGNRYPTVEVGYLRGTGRRPELRSFVLDRGRYGIGWDIKMDIGAKALDFRALYKADGA